MTDDVFPDPSTPFGQRVQRRLRDEQVIWLTTVGADGTPQPNPVWFLVDGTTVVVYNRPEPDASDTFDGIRGSPCISTGTVGAATSSC